ncbi:MAG TPA: ABC transporter substrate-binding protein, partial [Gaiellaceae bacterium]|nr:ABC transporter substrate-binding protein [Gaiellaceae bacterium]
SCCSEAWAFLVGNLPVTRGAYVLDDKLQYLPDLASKITVTKTTLTYDINPNANWYWGGKKLPVTWQDFAYTWKAFINPKNDVTGRNGYDAIASVTHKGLKDVTFHWRTSGCTATEPCGPYTDYRDLFVVVYPSAALKGMDFNKIWANCVCGSDGKPVSDGPYYLSNYTKGLGVTLKVNPFWYGPKPALKEVDFKLITDTNSEIQAMRGGELDAIAPSPQTSLSALRNQPGLVYSSVPGQGQEHVDIQFGPRSSNVLLRSPWMRQAIMMGMDRPALIKALFGTIAPNLQPLDSLLYYQSDKDNYVPDFKQWDYNPTRSLQILSKHCTGGPSTPTQGNTKIWTCSGLPAKFRYTTTLGNQRRETSYAIWKSELASIGIELDDALGPANVVFGPTVISAGNYDLFEFAWVTTPDAGQLVPVWSCKGESNYLNYCDNKVTMLLKASNSELDPAKRAADFKQADALMAKDLPSIPLYAPPAILVYKKGVSGMTDVGETTWNIYAWKWTS